MKKLNSITNKFNKAYIKAKEALRNKKGEGYVDTAVKIVISVVIGTLLLGGLYTLFDTNVIPTLSSKIASVFNYHG